MVIIQPSNPFTSFQNLGNSTALEPDATHGSIINPGSARGIFLHAGWRTAGTWLWSRFRALDRTTAFYEPLSTLVGEVSANDIDRIRPTYNSGHPPLSSAYFEEYRPFLRTNARGVSGYHSSFSVDRFGDAPSEDFPLLQAYLHDLCQAATNDGKIAVFKFCRSLGRLAWLKKAFPDATHAGILRNPASQFASGWLLRQQWRNVFFVAAPFRVLGLQQHEPIIKQLIAHCGVKLPVATSTSPAAYAAACDEYAQTVDGVDAYRAFIALWILSAWRILEHANIVVDSDMLGQSPEYACALSEIFRARSGLLPDFTGTRDLIDEAKRSVSRLSEIDGRALRPINSSALKFLFGKLDKTDSRQAAIAESIREKVALANTIADDWRYS